MRGLRAGVRGGGLVLFACLWAAGAAAALSVRAAVVCGGGAGAGPAALPAFRGPGGGAGGPAGVYVCAVGLVAGGAAGACGRRVPAAAGGGPMNGPSPTGLYQRLVELGDTLLLALTELAGLRTEVKELAARIAVLERLEEERDAAAVARARR